MSTRSEKGTVAKILVIGDVATGKTSIIQRYVYKTFDPNHNATLGVDFALKRVRVEENLLNVQLWDIAGQEVQRIQYDFEKIASNIFLSEIHWFGTNILQARSCSNCCLRHYKTRNIGQCTKMESRCRRQSLSSQWRQYSSCSDGKQS